LFKFGKVCLDGFEQTQIMLQQLRADGHQIGIWQERLLCPGNDLGGGLATQAVVLRFEGLYQVAWGHVGQLMRIGTDPEKMLQGLAVPHRPNVLREKSTANKGV
jgi:hypothetical protein